MKAEAGKSSLAALVAGVSLAACTAPGPQQMPTTASATEYCWTQSGTRAVERGPYGEIGVCVFEGNRQCEEWALLLGRCPRGGIPVGGYATTSERHCAIRGGRMTIPGCALSPVGLYETTSVRLVLDAGHVAVLSRALPGGTSQLVPGRWESSADVVTVTTENERLVFDHKSDRLIARDWDRAIWGGSGPGTLLLRN